ncbi:hypothetical protein CDAR_482101 [Caerostris darwini]|uniref:Uncharacterized protein n=1 Tax=Caerostris darwini TaxID=1538125 RepID=A0AAV4TKJ9_9ARAC|nr:hypothetical protein CDAR_482101 [Caerostris darwini]
MSCTGNLTTNYWAFLKGVRYQQLWGFSVPWLFCWTKIQPPFFPLNLNVGSLATFSQSVFSKLQRTSVIDVRYISRYCRRNLLHKKYVNNHSQEFGPQRDR